MVLSDVRGAPAILILAPPAADVAYEAATEGGISGWWCRPADVAKASAILYLHGGTYILGSADAYRNFVGQIARSARTAAFAPD
jgi:epsilon-lactone hydrolase